MNRVYNFSAGPSMMPESILKKAQEQMLCCGDSGMSVMEMSHRSKPFEAIIQGAEALLRELMGIPDNYKVLFLQGGGSTQFAMIPMNLMKKKKIDLVITGQWAKKAYEEAARYGEVHVVASSADKTFSYIPQLDASSFQSDADYFYICQNNTIYGTRYATLPQTGNVPLVADMSSCILSEPTDVSQYGLIFAGAQKNLGPAGLTIVIIREDLITDAMEDTPTMLKYATHVKANSLYNTPPTYAIYICKLMLEWIRDMGGVQAMYDVNQKKAKMLYNFLDNSKLFHPTVMGDSRSLMNVPFVTGDEALDAKFVKEAALAGLVNLKGHRTVGGMRASIYNAMPVAGVEKLIDFMNDFEKATI